MTVGPTVAPRSRASTPNWRIVASSTSPPCCTSCGSTLLDSLRLRMLPAGSFHGLLRWPGGRLISSCSPPVRPRPDERRILVVDELRDEHLVVVFVLGFFFLFLVLLVFFLVFLVLGVLAFLFLFFLVFLFFFLVLVFVFLFVGRFVVEGGAARVRRVDEVEVDVDIGHRSTSVRSGPS